MNFYCVLIACFGLFVIFFINRGLLDKRELCIVNAQISWRFFFCGNMELQIKMLFTLTFYILRLGTRDV